MIKYALTAAMIAILGLSAACLTLMARNASQSADNANLRLSIGACDARIANIEEDKDSDAEIDGMPDLRNVPERWLLP